MNKVPMTVEGAELLKAELNNLKTVQRPKIIEAIATARAHGDLKENAEYHAAREQQSFLEGRIRDIEAKLAHAHVIDVTSIENRGKVVFGATVTIINIDTDERITYKIVGEDEADIKQLKISVTSPISRALIGKNTGDCVEVKAPGGIVQYEIEVIEHL